LNWFLEQTIPGDRARGKLAKVAVVACMCKLLTIISARRRDELRGVALVMPTA
jgi:hypothetical protein